VKQQMILKILLVDDEPMILALNRAYCQRLFPGATILEAENGKIAFDLLCDEKPDLVISDLNMREMDGLELLRRSKREIPELKFVLLSGKMSTSVIEIANERGVSATLSKPYNFSIFTDVVKSL
jgi:YesN/AraC family two-component response regulator